MSDRDLTAQAQADIAWLEKHGAVAGVAAVVRERRRQIERHGYDLNHDNEHDRGWMTTEAALLAANAVYMIRFDPAGDEDSRDELAKAAALAAAEIDQLTPRPVITDPAGIEKLLHRRL
jgi:hypothetical protein